MPIDTAGWVRHMLDTTRDYVVVLIDAEAVIVGWQGTAENMFGCARAKAVGNDLTEVIVPPALREWFQRGLARVHHHAGRL